MQATVSREPGLDDSQRGELHQELEALEAEIIVGEDADEERIVEHQRRVGDPGPDFLGLVLTGLRQTQSEAQYLVQHAIEEANE